ncbi:6725_t:CDS:1, partial [Cetraspora pellucida]
IVQSTSQGIIQSTSQSTSNKTINQITLHQKLINIIEQLPDDQLKAAVHLFKTMRYSKGPNEGKLLSSFLQNKALNFIKAFIYKLFQDPSLLIQSNKTLQKKIDQLEHSNTKKYHKVRQLVGTLLQYKRKQSQHILKVHAAAHKPQLADSRSLNASIQAIIKKNKRHYTTQFINMTTQ